jgi:L-lactate dehydrogenase complex protein LldF
VDIKRQGLLAYATGNYLAKRDSGRKRFRDWEGARRQAEAIKDEALGNLDKYLQQFIEKVEERGGKVFCAEDAQSARDYITRLAAERGVRSVVKSKSMTTEEIHLNSALERKGVRVLETDLGEFIVQLLGETPYHIVFPAVHLSKGEVSDLFNAKLGSARTDDIEALTMIAREHLRKEYCSADMGISGANFAVAETGMISITENEGNARLTMGLPKIHVAVVGIEKILPRMADLSFFLQVLPTMGTGQWMSCYNTLVGGARGTDEVDGPGEFHVVLLDNGRSKLLADAESREALRCIRCGGCLNVCPVYQTVGGHSYGTVYPGPIGAVITPLLRGLKEWGHLSYASSLCEACTEICPVRIGLHKRLLSNRRNYADKYGPWAEKLGFKMFAFVSRHPVLWRLSGTLAAAGQYLYPLVGWFPGNPLKGWTMGRALPKISWKSFRNMWANRGGKIS